VSKSATLDDPERPICTLLQKRCVFRSPPQNANADRLILSLSAAKRKASVSGDIRFMRIFAEVPWEGSVKRQWDYGPVGLSRMAIFRTFSLAIFRIL